MEHQPSPTPATLDYEIPTPQSRYRSVLVWIQIAVFFSAMAWGLYGSTIVRGMAPGSLLPRLVIINAIILSPALVLLLGLLLWLRRWQYVAAIALLVVVPPVAADAYCTLEERLFVAGARQLPTNAPTVYKPGRWWPNANSSLWYEPSTGELGGSD